MIFMLLLAAILNTNQNPPLYTIYNKEGKAVSEMELWKASGKSQVILFGEQHENAIAHYLQLRLAQHLFEEKKDHLLMGAEMFETDDQIVLDEYLAGYYEYRHFSKEAKLWPNFETDYKPILEFARNNKLKFIATNCPRRYASMVAMKGIDSLSILSNTAKSFLPPLPVPIDLTLPGYKNMTSMGGHGTMNFMAEAQALKDATMASFILKNLKADQTFLHLNGSYHSNNYEGIYWYLKKADKDLKILTIATVSQRDLGKLEDENKNLADFILVTDESFPGTH